MILRLFTYGLDQIIYGMVSSIPQQNEFIELTTRTHKKWLKLLQNQSSITNTVLGVKILPVCA